MAITKFFRSAITSHIICKLGCFADPSGLTLSFKALGCGSWAIIYLVIIVGYFVFPAEAEQL